MFFMVIKVMVYINKGILLLQSEGQIQCKSLQKNSVVKYTE